MSRLISAVQGAWRGDAALDHFTVVCAPYHRTIRQYSHDPPMVEWDEPLQVAASPHAVYLVLPPSAAGAFFWHCTLLPSVGY